MMWAINSIRFSEGSNPTISSRCLESAGCRRDSGFRAERRLSRDLCGEARGLYTFLHAFQKKAQATPKRDLEIAKNRFGQMLGGRK